MNKKPLFGFLAAVFLIAPFLAHSATLEADKNYYLAPNVTINDNLYVAGSDANVSGAVSGDLFVFGGNVIVSGPVSGDLMSAGGTLNISGKVSGDERVAGGNIMISNPVGGDLLVAGGQINILSGSVVEKDIEIIGGAINYGGESKGRLSINGGDVFINGKVSGDLSVNARNVRIGPNAVITGNFDYSSPVQATIEQGSVIKGETNFTKIAMPQKKETSGSKGFLGFVSVIMLIKLIAIAIAVLILNKLFKKQIQIVVEESLSKFWNNAGKGFVWLIIIPIAIILSFVTIIGSVLGVFAGLIYAVFIILSSIIANLLFVRLCMKYIFKKEEYELNWWIIILGVFVFGIIMLIPFIGWLFKFIVFLATFGSLSAYIVNKFKD